LLALGCTQADTHVQLDFDFFRAIFSPSPSANADSSLSPASSTADSAPSSPYTPANASFHPSVFTSSATQSSLSPPDAFYDYPGDMDMGLGLFEPASGTQCNSDASAWMEFPSPWASTSTSTSTGSPFDLVQGDFDIGRVPALGWGMDAALAPYEDSAFVFRGKAVSESTELGPQSENSGMRGLEFNDNDVAVYPL
jgi:hypothetical protein